jgi:hypothetical protein
MSPTPIRVGDFARDEDEEEARLPPPPKAPFAPPCDDCFHSLVCSVLHEIKKVGAPLGAPIVVGFCPFHMPLEEKDAETQPPNLDVR